MILVFVCAEWAEVSGKILSLVELCCNNSIQFREVGRIQIWMLTPVISKDVR